MKDEKKKPEEVKEEVEPVSKDEVEATGEQPEILDKIDKATAAAKRLEDANTKHEELLIKQEALQADEILGGKSVVTKKKTKEDEELEAAKVLAGDFTCEGVND